MRSPRVSPARLSALNAGIQLLWGAILAVELQARSLELGGNDAVAKYALVAAAGALVATIVQLAAGYFSDAEREKSGGRQRYFAIGIALTVPALLWFFFAPTYAQLVVAFVALEFATNIAGGPYQAIIPDYVERARRGIASSWMSAAQSFGNAVGLVIAAFVADLRIVAASIAVPLVATYAITAGHARSLAVRPPESSPAGSAYGRTLAALMISRGFINVGFFTLLGFLLFFVRDSLGVAESAVKLNTGLIFLTFTLSAVAGAVLTARASDTYDKRLVVSVTIAAIAIALAVLAGSQSLPVAYAGALFAGISWGAFATADWALATAVLPPEGMGTAMGIWNVATTVPQVIAPLLTAPLVVRFNAVHAGAGPRAAIVLSLVEFAIGGAAIWRLPRV